MRSAVSSSVVWKCVNMDGSAMTQLARLIYKAFGEDFL